MRCEAKLFCIFFLSICLWCVNETSYAQTTAELFTQANQLTHARKHKQAIPLYQKILRSQPKNISALQGLGLNYLFLKKYTESSKALNEAIRLDPNNTKTLMALGSLYENQSIFYEAIFHYEKVLKLDPYHLDAYWGKGRVLNSDHQYRNAITVFKKILEFDPYHKGALQGMANAYRGLKLYEAAADVEKKIVEIYSEDRKTPTEIERHADIFKDADLKTTDDLFTRANRLTNARKYKQAIAVYQKILRSQPKNIAALQGLGLNYLFLKKYTASSKAFNEAIRLDPNNTKTLMALGSLYENQSIFYEALFHYEKVLKLDPYHLDAYWGKGRVLNSDHQYRNAITVFKKILGFDPYHKGALQGMANAYRGLELYEAAVDSEKKILEVYSEDIGTLMRIARHYEFLKDTENAILWYEKVKELDPENETVYVRLALLYRRALEIDSFVTSLQKTIEIQQGNIDNYIILGRVYGWMFRIEEGIEVYKKALRMDPMNVMLHNELANLELKAGRWDEAEITFKKALTLDPKDKDALEGIDKVILEKRPIFISRYNIEVDKNKDPLLDRQTTEQQIANEVEYKFSPSFLIEGRYQFNEEHQDILAGDREYEFHHDIISLKFQKKFGDWLTVACRPSYNRYKNIEDNTFMFRESYQRISVFSFAVMTHDKFFSVPSFVRGLLVKQQSPNILRIDPFYSYGSSIGYNFTSDLQSITRYSYVEFQVLHDNHEIETTLTYRLPFWNKRIQLGYGFDWVNTPLARKHTLMSRFKDRLPGNISTDFKYNFSFDHKKVDSGLTLVHTIESLLSAPLYKTLTFNFNGVWEWERNKDHDFVQTYRLFLQVPLGIF